MALTQTEQIALIKSQLTASKEGDYTLVITKQPPLPEPTVIKYTREYLDNQLQGIQNRQDLDNAEREKEKAEIQALIELADEQKIIIKPV